MWVWLSVGNLAHILHCRAGLGPRRHAHEVRIGSAQSRAIFASVLTTAVVLAASSIGGTKSSVIGSLEPTKILPAPLFVVVLNALAGNDGRHLLSEKPFGRRLISTRFTTRRA
jgi:hypothetical protein